MGRKEQCHFDGCNKLARSKKGFCVAHGGGFRCQIEGCTKSARTSGETAYCISHGGGLKCKFVGCHKSTQGKTDWCIEHGGGYKCQLPGCNTSTRGSAMFCLAHTNSKRPPALQGLSYIPSQGVIARAQLRVTQAQLAAAQYQQAAAQSGAHDHALVSALAQGANGSPAAVPGLALAPAGGIYMPDMAALSAEHAKLMASASQLTPAPQLPNGMQAGLSGPSITTTDFAALQQQAAQAGLVLTPVGSGLQGAELLEQFDVEGPPPLPSAGLGLSSGLPPLSLSLPAFDTPALEMRAEGGALNGMATTAKTEAKQQEQQKAKQTAKKGKGSAASADPSTPKARPLSPPSSAQGGGCLDLLVAAALGGDDDSSFAPNSGSSKGGKAKRRKQA